MAETVHHLPAEAAAQAAPHCTPDYDAWSDTSRRHLAAELRRLAHRLARHDGVDAGAASAVIDDEPAAALSQPSALDLVQARFGLTMFERDVLLLCAAFALDPALAERHGPATFALARTITTAPDIRWTALAPARPLRRYRLIGG